MTEEQSNAVKHAALSWLQTPFHHQASLKRVGVDCVHLIVAVYVEAGLLSNVILPAYRRTEKPILMMGTLGKYCEEANKEAMQIGDVLVFMVNDQPQHAALYLGDVMIHASASARMVVCEPLTPLLMKSLHSVWRLNV